MNSKILILFGMIVIVGLITVNAGPVHLEEELDELIHREGETLLELRPRHRRVTCDLFSAQISGFSINDAACAAKCLIQSFKGGRCNDGVCHCRR